MEDKTRKLLLALETLALLTAAILILIDYKLKQDLVELTRNVENALKQANERFPTNTDTASDSGDLHSGTGVRDATGMEAAISTIKASQNGKTPTSARPRSTAKRSGGNRSTPVQGLDNPVGS